MTFMQDSETAGAGVGNTSVAPPKNRRLDRVLDDEYLAGLRRRSLAEVRALRAEIEQEEADLSYLRRLIHGRLDILRAEVQRREVAGSATLLDGLVAILAEEHRPPARGLGRHTTVEPSHADSHRRYIDSLVSDVELSDVVTRTVDELAQALSVLSQEEASISATRKHVHSVMDACSAEITRRYRDGEADVDALLRPAGS